ncbi:MAG: vitamin B12-dependent ribonucleotide reductase, partial [Planctomycetales bacterium]|nr:vitamin B12-dependent ribonucleotide reductase [Planctomycetales bacterium]
GWKLGLKALAIYRDGSKESQPLSTSTEGDKAKDKEAAALAGKPRRERLPDTRASLTHKFNVSGHEGYITVGLYPDGRPGELFITMAKEGSTVGGLMDAFGTAVSMSLQYGVPLQDYVRKFSHMRFEPQGFTKNPDIRIAKSLIDYIFRWLGMQFLPGYKEASLGIDPDVGGGAGSSSTGEGKGDAPFSESKPVAKKDGGQLKGQEASGQVATKSTTVGNSGPAASPQAGVNGKHANGHANGTNGYSNGHGGSVKLTDAATKALYGPKLLERAGVMIKPEAGGGNARSEQFAGFQTDAPSCDNCGAITVRNGNCYLCHNCGNSMGCS